MNLSAAVRSYFFFLRGNGIKKARSYRNFLERLPNQDQPLENITPQILQDHLSRYAHLSAGSRNIVKSCMHGFFNWALENDFISKDPSRLLKREKHICQEQHFMSLPEISKFRKAIQSNVRDQLLFECYLQLGLRLSEVRNLNVWDVRNRLQARIIGKGSKVRIVPIPETLADLITKTVNGKPDSSPLFISQRGNRLSKKQIQSRFKAYLRKAKIDSRKYHIHSLRHSFASHLYGRTKDLLLVSQLLGHASISTTQRYAHLNEEIKRQAVNNLYV